MFTLVIVLASVSLGAIAGVWLVCKLLDYIWPF